MCNAIPRNHLKPKFFRFVACNPFYSSPSLTILVPLCSLFGVFYLCKLLFSGFLNLKVMLYVAKINVLEWSFFEALRDFFINISKLNPRSFQT